MKNMVIVIYSFGYFYSSTTQRRSRLQHGYCIGVSPGSAQATAGKGLAQGPYVTARAGVEPTTLRLKVVDSTKAPSHPTSVGKSQILSSRRLLANLKYYQADVCWQISNTIKQTK